MKKSWDVIRSLSGLNNNKKCNNVLTDNNGSPLNPAEISENFVDFFSKIAHDLNENLPTNDINPCSLVDRNRHTFYLFPVSSEECMKIISNLKIVKTHLNEMPVKIFKSISAYVSDPLSKMINQSFLQGIFPSILKLARVTPIYKNGDKSNPTNYRPISSLHHITLVRYMKDW